MSEDTRSASSAPAASAPGSPAAAAPAEQPARRPTLPVKIGLFFGGLGLLLTTVGVFRGQVPFAPANIAVALLLGGGVWFVIAWAVATAAVDVERDLEP